MKNLILVFAISIILFSCSKESDEKIVSDFELLGKWQLTTMSWMMVGSQTTGSDMEWQEYYIFNDNGTFIKHRERNNETIEIFGDYNFISDSNTIYLDLIYPSDNDIIGNCYANYLKELLFIDTNKKLSNTWNACDGPTLKYDKIN